MPALGEEGTPTPSVHELVRRSGVLDDAAGRPWDMGHFGGEDADGDLGDAVFDSNHVAAWAKQEGLVSDDFDAGQSNTSHIGSAPHTFNMQEWPGSGAQTASDRMEQFSFMDAQSQRHGSGSGSDSTGVSSMATTSLEAPQMTELAPPPNVSCMKRANKPTMRLTMPPPPYQRSKAAPVQPQRFETFDHGLLDFDEASSATMNSSMDWTYDLRE